MTHNSACALLNGRARRHATPFPFHIARHPCVRSHWDDVRNGLSAWPRAARMASWGKPTWWHTRDVSRTRVRATHVTDRATPLHTAITMDGTTQNCGGCAVVAIRPLHTYLGRDLDNFEGRGQRVRKAV